jgi:hypothetical protein
MPPSRFAFRLYERFTYEYNFLDARLLAIRFQGEHALEPKGHYPRCVTGARRTPPANAMATGNSAPAAPSTHPDAEWQVARDISTLMARDDASLSPRFVVVSDKVVVQWILLQITRASVTSHQAMPVRPDGGENLKNKHFLLATQAVTTRRAWWRCWLGHSGLSYRCWPQASLRVFQHPASTRPAPEIDLAR